VEKPRLNVLIWSAIRQNQHRGAIGTIQLRPSLPKEAIDGLFDNKHQYRMKGFDFDLES